MHSLPNNIHTFLLALLVMWVTAGASGAENIEYNASLNVNAATGEFAPYMIGSWNNGRAVTANSIWQNGELKRNINKDKRFSWGYGLEYELGYGSAVKYDRFQNGAWTVSQNRQSPARLIQLYGMLKYRQCFLLAGMKEHQSPIVDQELSSGDLTLSNNARPIPGAAAGFIDFVDIPLTKGWVQIYGEIMYGRFTDNGYRDKQFNFYTGIYATSLCYTYKSCLFRTNASKPFRVTVGMQTAGLFGGYTETYQYGSLVTQERRGFRFRDIFDMFLPREGSGESYYKGQSLGSWSFKADYRFINGYQLDAYFEWPFEDGSAIGRRNGWDGLWGLRLSTGRKGIISAIVVEYLDFTNHSGPIHFSPTDAPGTTIAGHANGGDNYYNNSFYGAYANYGMSIATPFLLAPVYNTDGSTAFEHNRARGFHAAATGNVCSTVKWKAAVSYQHAWGTGRTPSSKTYNNTSALLQASWTPLNHWNFTARVAFDAGNLRGNNFGGTLSATYHGNFTLGK